MGTEGRHLGDFSREACRLVTDLLLDSPQEASTAPSLQSSPSHLSFQKGAPGVKETKRALEAQQTPDCRAETQRLQQIRSAINAACDFDNAVALPDARLIVLTGASRG